MVFRKIILIFHCIAVSWSHPLQGQHHQERFDAIDVLTYRFEIDLNDSSDIIYGKALLEILFKKDLDQFSLDLKSKDNEGKGMLVERVTQGGDTLEYIHADDRVKILVPGTTKGTRRRIEVEYRGTPDDGLIISKNKFGDRTFFADNWPNRAHHWLPVVDHPSDKAQVEFLVAAPGHYQVVANGQMISEEHQDGTIFSHWKTTVPLPTKVMVIGVSPFVTQSLESASGIPVSTYVFPQNKEEGFLDYSIATRPMDFFEGYIAPYPYAKLANVQSKTVYGGMENASCIFYSENSVNGRHENETLFAHEIAHQWFGDAVTELNWHHIWISEGFATYLTDLYLEKTHDREALVISLVRERNRVLRYSERRLAPIIDTTLEVSTRLLNSNTYQKAGWVLHMLRRELGDEQFHQCIQKFYETYKFENVLTRDFERIVEEVSGKDFSTFFRQWYYEPGHPVLSTSWTYRRNKISLTISQHQDRPVFDFPLDVEVTLRKGNPIRKTFQINAPRQTFVIPSEVKPSGIILDPDTWLLYQDF